MGIRFDRLAQLAVYLRHVPKERFQMASWAEGKPFCGVMDPPEAEHPKPACGTTACAMGWATTYPPFRKAGLKMEWDLNDKTGLGDGVIQYKDEDGFHAARAFFNLPKDHAEYLFGGLSRRTETPVKVAERLEDYIVTAGKTPKAEKWILKYMNYY